MHKSFVITAHRTAGTLIFWLQVPGMTLYLQLIYPTGALLQMTDGHTLFRLYALVICVHCPPPPPPPPAQGNVEDFDFVSAVPHSYQTNTLWGQLAGKTMTVFPRSLLLYCTAMVAYVYQTPTFHPYYGDNINLKSQHICQANPALLRGLGEAVVTNEWCIIYSL